MGKLRIKTLGDEEQEKEQKKKTERKREAKKAAEKVATLDVEEPVNTNVIANEAADAAISSEGIASSPSTPLRIPRNDETKKTKKKKSKFQKQTQTRSNKYNKARAKVDRTKRYPLQEALELLPQVHIAKFDESVELHINTEETGVSGTTQLPHGTGKKLRIAIADDAVLERVEKGKIDFDILLAQPAMMPRLAKVAKILGPRGLMPNPKNGTVTQNPEETAKKYEGGHMNYKTEAKNPIIHMTIGKLSFGPEKLKENIKTVLSSLKNAKLKQAVLKSTMSPGIKLQL